MTQISFSYENPLKSRFGEDFFKGLPQRSGVYFFMDAKGRPLYIGKADNLKRRLMSYQAAKPGQAPEHILEMIELADDLRFEFHSCGEAALRRETELIRAVRPPFNIAGTEPVPYLYWGVRAQEDMDEDSPNTVVDFRLSHCEIGEGFTSYGCFRHRGKTKSAYSALLRLFFASVCERERFQLPAKICRSSPPYVYKGQMPTDWVSSLDKFLRGERTTLLTQIMGRLLERENIPPYLYAPLQRDLNLVKEFFEIGAKDTRAIAKAVGTRKTSVTQAKMDRYLARQLKSEVPARSLSR